MTCSDQARSYLRLLSIRGIGPRTGRQLVSECGSINALWNRSTDQWKQTEGVSQKLLSALQHTSSQSIDHILAQCGKYEVDILCIEDEAYPDALRTCDDAPLILYTKGDVQTLSNSPILAIVGARKASRESKLIARRWSAFFSRQGITVVSGMAYGIDAAAHGGALEGNSPTIAVLGCGLGTLANTQQHQAEAVAEQGCVISEYSPETSARPEHFPQRNRIIAGLCQATVVIEAGIRSGSMITAGQSLAYGREVFAVPGPVLTESHHGCHQLIRDGAHLADSAEMILRTLNWGNRSSSTLDNYIPANVEEAAVIDALRQETMHLDSLAEACNLTVPELSPCLLALELLGVIERLPGSRFALGGRIHERSCRGGVTR